MGVVVVNELNDECGAGNSAVASDQHLRELIAGSESGVPGPENGVESQIKKLRDPYGRRSTRPAARSSRGLEKAATASDFAQIEADSLRCLSTGLHGPILRSQLPLSVLFRIV